MELTEQRLLRRLQSVDVFGEEHRDEFSATSRARQLFDDLKPILADLQDAQTEQTASTGGAKGSTRAKATILGELWRDTGRIEATAREMRTLPDDQKGVFVRGSRREPDVVATAKAFIAAATPIWNQFVAYELPADLLEEMQNDVDDYTNYFASQQGQQQSRVSSGATIESALERGGEILDELRPIVKNKFDGNDAILSEWASATRYPSRAQTPKPASTPPS